MMIVNKTQRLVFHSVSLATIALLPPLSGCGDSSSVESRAIQRKPLSAVSVKTSSEIAVESLNQAQDDSPGSVSLDVFAPNSDQDAAGLDRLTIGSRAAVLDVEWIMGEPLDGFESHKVHVIEFWATSCAPCLRSVPHISQLQGDYADRVNFIGISDEDTATIEQFLTRVRDKASGQTWGETIKYRIAAEGVRRPMSERYMVAAAQRGIPTAFIVDTRGLVQWIGHPLRIDEPLLKIVNGQWDSVAARRVFESGRVVEQLTQSLGPMINDARLDGDWSSVLAAIDESMTEDVDFYPIGKLKLEILLTANLPQEAQTLGARLAEAKWNEAAELNELAWRLATRIAAEDHNREMQLTIAKRAAKLTRYENASILDTLARVYYVQSNLAEAIKWQEAAVDAADDGNRQKIQATLERYLAERDAEGVSSEVVGQKKI